MRKRKGRMDKRKFKRLAKKSLYLEPSLIDITNDKELMDRVLKQSARTQEEIRKRTLVEIAKAEARQNLSGEDLEKCYKALEAWARNTMTTVGWR